MPRPRLQDSGPLWLSLCDQLQIPRPVAEHRFHPVRRWRFDFAWPQAMVALEIEGGAWVGGRHVRGKGFKDDMDKYNAAALLGWRVVRSCPDAVERVLVIVRAMLTQARLEV